MSITRTPGASASARRLVITGAIGALVIIDQVTKYVITASFHLGESRNVIPGFFDITHVRNPGAAFGFLAGVDSAWVQRGFTVFTFIALAVIWGLYRSMRPEERLGRVSLVMIGAGAIGNLIDRVQSGAVTDFLLFYIGEYQWPAFNVADSLITVGVAILAYTLVFHQPAHEPAP